MHPPEFVAKMLDNGRANELAEMVDRFAASHYERKEKGHEMAYNFVKVLMFAVVCQLRRLPEGQTVQDDHVLKVWAGDLGYWGVDRAEIARLIETGEV